MINGNVLLLTRRTVAQKTFHVTWFNERMKEGQTATLLKTRLHTTPLNPGQARPLRSYTQTPGHSPATISAPYYTTPAFAEADTNMLHRSWKNNVLTMR